MYVHVCLQMLHSVLMSMAEMPVIQPFCNIFSRPADIKKISCDDNERRQKSELSKISFLVSISRETLKDKTTGPFVFSFPVEREHSYCLFIYISVIKQI